MKLKLELSKNVRVPRAAHQQQRKAEEQVGLSLLQGKGTNCTLSVCNTDTVHLRAMKELAGVTEVLQHVKAWR